MTCEKRCFASKRAVLRFYKSWRGGCRIRTYYCRECKAYHVTTKAVRYDKEVGQWR